MAPRILLTAALLLAGAAKAQQQPTYDADGDGDIDADDWEATQPPAPQGDDSWAQYPGEQAPQTAPTQQDFNAQLSPYGAWYDEPGVGQVWQPSPNEVGSDFVPYTTGGSWGYSPVGWQFASTYRFGSAPFHYGRWFRSPRYGWVWWPQYQWGPSWVDWRCNRAGNVAWAPLSPWGSAAVRFGGGAPYWSYAYGRYHRPHMSSFSWGRYGGYRGGYGYRGGGGYSGGGGGYYRGGGGYYRGGGYRGGGGYHSASPVGGGFSHGGGGFGHHGRH